MNAHVTSPLARAPLTALGPEPVIVAGDVTLRPHRLADADAIAASLSDGRVSSMLARVPAPYFRQDALDWLVPVTSGLLPGWRSPSRRATIRISVACRSSGAMAPSSSATG